MKATPDSATVDLPEEIQELLDRYTRQIQQNWAVDLEGLLLYGSAARGDYILGRSNLNILLVVQQMTEEHLQRAGQLHREWGKHQIVAPLVMTAQDLERSRQFFPLEFFQMAQSHVVLAGRNPFRVTEVDSDRLAWQCEHELFANFLRVRQRFIEAEGKIEGIHTLLNLSVTGVLPCLRGLHQCLGGHAGDKDMELLEKLPLTIQFDPTVLQEILRIKRGLSSPGKYEWLKTYNRYLENLEALIQRVQVFRQKAKS